MSNDAESSIAAIARSVTSAVRTELLRGLKEFERDLTGQLVERIGVAHASTASAVRVVTDSQREMSTSLASRLTDLGQRLDVVADAQTIVRNDVLGSLAASRMETDQILSAIDKARSQLDRRIDLNDAMQVIRLRDEIETSLKAYLIREFSRAIAPALDRLQQVTLEGDTNAISRAYDVLFKRCQQVGLITDVNQLF